MGEPPNKGKACAWTPHPQFTKSLRFLQGVILIKNASETRVPRMLPLLLFAASVLASSAFAFNHFGSQQNAQATTPNRQASQQDQQVVIINKTEHAVTVAIDFSGVSLIETSFLKADSRTSQPMHPTQGSGIMKIRVGFGTDDVLEKEVHFFSFTGRLAVVIESEESIQLIM